MTADPPTPRNPDSEAERLRTALERIRTEGGSVCANFERCTHVACQSSVAAWMIADAALKGETPESANATFGSGNQSLPQEAFGGPAATDRATPREKS